MEYQRQTRMWGAAAIVLAVVIRLLSAGFFQPLLRLLQQQELIGFILYMETGWVVRFDMPLPEETTPGPTDPPEEETPPKQESLIFTEADLVPVQYHCSHRPALFELLNRPLSWAPAQEGPTVLIVHTHATETYTGEDISYSGTYRTLENHKNMVSIGREVARVLNAGGVGVVHDETLHDYPNYNGAYESSREAITAYLKKYPSIRMVLDIHRDASSDTQGSLLTSATVAGQNSAQLMMVVGTRSERWEENLSLALKLSALLERTDPGICRPLDLRSERFNVDLSVGSLLVEVGATGNTHEEAMIAANALAQAVTELLMDNG